MIKKLRIKIAYYFYNKCKSLENGEVFYGYWVLYRLYFYLALKFYPFLNGWFDDNHEVGFNSLELYLEFCATKNFVDLCGSDEEEIFFIDDYVKKWHESKHLRCSLAEYLGMTVEEYKIFAENPDCLVDIVNKRKGNR